MKNCSIKLAAGVLIAAAATSMPMRLLLATWG